MIGHLGPRVSALLDGQLPPAEADAAWAHVYACHLCRDQVEREGWVKTRLAGLGAPDRETPTDLKGSLLNLTPAPSVPGLPTGSRRAPFGGGIGAPGLALIGGGALGAAMVGMLALGALPGGGTADRRPPAAQINTTTPAAPLGSAGLTTTGQPQGRLPGPLDRFFE